MVNPIFSRSGFDIVDIESDDVVFLLLNEPGDVRSRFGNNRVLCGVLGVS